MSHHQWGGVLAVGGVWRVLGALGVLGTLGVLPELGSAAGLESEARLESEAESASVMTYDAPARKFTEALPLGNGRLGATVYGDPIHERITLNEDTVWAGGPHRNLNPQGAAHLAEIRELLFRGKYAQAQDVCQKYLADGTDNGMPYQVAAGLRIDFATPATPEDLHGYRRNLDLDRAIATTEYQTAKGTIVRETFTSFADNVVVLHFVATGDETLNFDVEFETPQTVRNRFAKRIPDTESAKKAATDYIRQYVPERATTALENGTLRLDATTSDHEGVSGQLQYDARLWMRHTDGNRVENETNLRIENATEVLILIDIRTNFIDYQTLGGDPAAKTWEKLDSLKNRTYAELRDAHVAVYRPMFRRVTLDLGTTCEDLRRLPTDQRVERFTTEAFDSDLVELVYQFGRYLLICSSMPGTQPATLQGIWCENKFPPWDSKYTVNANTPMNYWPAETTNLAETHEPLVAMVQEMTQTGADAAKTLYGCRGWVFHHNTDLWRVSGVVDASFYGQWVSSNAWFCHHLWDRYQFSGDRKYLATVYPTMRSACEFFLDFLVADPETGYLLSGPSNSPENAPAAHPGVSVYMGCTMDQQLIFDLFSNTLAAVESLELEGEEAAFTAALHEAMAKLPPMRIGQYGQIQEWFYDWDNPNDKHRHVSHLWGLCPGALISPLTTPELYSGAVRTLEQRGDDATGWSLAWKIGFQARLLDGEHAWKMIGMQLRPAWQKDGGERSGTYSNLWDAHPPFQIDGNFGFTANVTEMLLQSSSGAVHPLPAIPAIWREGRVTGLRARGGFLIHEMAWKDGRLTKLEIESTVGGVLRLRSETPLTTQTGEAIPTATDSKCPNPLLAFPVVPKPEISPDAPPPIPFQKTYYLYDLPTTPGQRVDLIPAP